MKTSNVQLIKISNVQLWSIIILLLVFLLYIIHININLYDRYIGVSGELGAVIFTESTVAVPNITLIIIVIAFLLFILYLYTKRQPEGGKE